MALFDEAQEKVVAEFLNNVWQMAGWSAELGGEAMVSRRLSGRKLLLFRKLDGTLTIMDDRCPHRFAPLSLGTRKGDVVTCGYHGLRFNGEGQCVHNPFSERIPVGATVSTYPVVERDGIIWCWLGDRKRADDALIADFSFLAETPTNHIVYGYTLVKAHYELGTDNLMDLSHIEFVHKTSLAGRGVIFAGKHEVVQNGDTLHSNWWMPNVAAPGHTLGVYSPDMRTDHWLEMRWNAPATMYLQIGATPVGASREEGCIANQAHILTPETDATTHYFWATTRDHHVESIEMDEMLKALFAQAFDEEDKPMIQAVFENMEGQDFWNCKPIFLGVDAGGTRTRRLLESLRNRERGGSEAGMEVPAGVSA